MGEMISRELAMVEPENKYKKNLKIGERLKRENSQDGDAQKEDQKTKHYKFRGEKFFLVLSLDYSPRSFGSNNSNES